MKDLAINSIDDPILARLENEMANGRRVENTDVDTLICTVRKLLQYRSTVQLVAGI